MVQIDPSAVGRGLEVMEPLPPAEAEAEAEAADMLSSLPAHLLDEILTRLDLRDAVRTSVLSWAWRRRWESIPSLAICFPKGARPSVIARVLLRYTGPTISRFASYVADDDDVDDWLIALSRRSVESISIIKDWGLHLGHLTLHSSIFSCHRLVSLDLQHCGIPPLPRSGFAGFPLLQELYLIHVDFTDKGGTELQAIIRGSPLLRVLELVEVFARGDCVIEAPNLQTLVLDSEYDEGWRLGCLPCLQYARIDVQVCEHGGQRLLDFFAGVSQVQELKFYSPANQDEVKIHRIPFTFHNLKRLEISTLFGYMEPILILFSLLRSSPNLEELKIDIRDWKHSDFLSEEWADAQWTDGMCANLQVVQIDCYFQGFPLYFLKLILSKASLLRTLSVDECPISLDDPLNQLLKFRIKEDLDTYMDGELNDNGGLQEDLDTDMDGELSE